LREAQCDPTKVHTKEFTTMALDKSAVSELLDALRAGGDLDVIREGLALVLQALIEAEAAPDAGHMYTVGTTQPVDFSSLSVSNVRLRILPCARASTP
jgi:hypothetical protein